MAHYSRAGRQPIHHALESNRLDKAEVVTEINHFRSLVGLGLIKIKPRTCMTCGIKFESHGPFNRLCTYCRRKN